MRVGEGGCGWSGRHGEGDEAGTARLAMRDNMMGIKLECPQRSQQLNDCRAVD
jgi:hypothetical protein